MFIMQKINHSYKMGTIKQIKRENKYNIKNQTYCFYHDIIDIKNFESTLLKIDKKII